MLSVGPLSVRELYRLEGLSIQMSASCTARVAEAHLVFGRRIFEHGHGRRRRLLGTVERCG